jgi:hypothetical protein
VSAVGNSIQECFAEPDIAKDLSPFRKRQIRGHDDRGSFRAIGDNLEEQFGANVGKRNVADFINGNQFIAEPSGEHAAQLVLMFGFEKFVDQARRRCESNAFLLTASRDAQCRGQVSFTGSAFPDQNHWLGTTDIAAISQLTNAYRRHSGL